MSATAEHTLLTTDPERVAELIGIPTDRWAWNCHGVSVALRQAGLPGRVRRGIHVQCRGQHSWVELPDGRIVDATAHAFIGGPPRVLTPSDLTKYDACSWRARAGVRYPPDVGETERELVELALGCHDYVADLLGLYSDYHGDGGGFNDAWLQCSVEQVYWLANLPVADREGPGAISRFFAAEIYEALEQAGHKVAVPIDDWHHVMDVPYPHEPARP